MKKQRNFPGHTHQYQLSYIGKPVGKDAKPKHKVYACILSGCYHYLHAFAAPPSLKTLCSLCHKEMEIKTKSLDNGELSICSECLEKSSPTTKSESEVSTKKA